MLISLNWLKEYVDVKGDVKTLAERLTLAGNEVAVRVAARRLPLDARDCGKRHLNAI